MWNATGIGLMEKEVGMVGERPIRARSAPPSMPQVPGRVASGRPRPCPLDQIRGNRWRDLAGKVAVVTGGGSGIGLATATHLAEAGVAVAVVDLDGESAERVAAGLRGLGLQADVGRSDEWPGIVDAVTTRFGGIDLAHLNAGVTTGEADITNVTDDIYRRAVGVNVDGVVFGVRALVPAISARGGGAIVATASLAGLIGFSPDPIYCLTKHAVVGLVRSLGPQLAERKITINAVCPSIVDTPLIDESRGLLESQWLPAHRRVAVPRRWSTGCPARRPARPWSSRPVVRRCPSGSPGLPGPGPAARWARCRRPSSPPTTRADPTVAGPPNRRGCQWPSMPTPHTRSTSPVETTSADSDTDQPTRPTPAKSPPVRTPVIQTAAPV